MERGVRDRERKSEAAGRGVHKKNSSSKPLTEKRRGADYCKLL